MRRNKWFIAVNTQDDNVLSRIIEYGREKDSDYSSSDEITWDDCAFRHWSDNVSWNPTNLVSLISTKFPDLIFSMEYAGDDGTGKMFIHNGSIIYENEIWKNPPFPSITLLKKALLLKLKKSESKRLEEEKKKAAKELADKKAQIKQLEDKIKQIKASL